MISALTGDEMSMVGGQMAEQEETSPRYDSHRVNSSHMKQADIITNIIEDKRSYGSNRTTALPMEKPEKRSENEMPINHNNETLPRIDRQ
jgi:hypothetical protein